jgi:DinB superfamily
MKKTDLLFVPEFFDRYTDLAPEGNLNDLLAASLRDLQTMDLTPYEALGDYVYAPGKWTLRDVFQHLIDTERIMAYRAMRIARNDKTALPGFEENDFAENTTASARTLADLRDEWVAVRQSNVALFNSFSEEMFHRIGTASNKPITPLALGFVLLGHPIHHFNVIHDRYMERSEGERKKGQMDK